MGRHKGFARKPSAADVERIALEIALARHLTYEAVLHGRGREATRARHDAWLRILDETGCSMCGLEAVWGIDRHAIWRVVKRHREALSTDKVRDAA
jgi:hypothetical protein